MRHSRKNGTRKEHAIAPEHILEVRGLNVRIKVDDYVLHAVRGVSFDMKKGETLGLVGESGCGKSVTSKEILGINPDNCSAQGEILYRTKSGQVLNLLELDRDGAGYRAIRGAEIAMIFQEPMTAFSPLYTIGNQLGEIVRIHQPETSKNGARERVLEMLKKCKLLIIDDIGAEKVTEWVRERLVSIINTRVSGGLSTIYTSNLSPDELVSQFEERIASRVLGCSQIIEITGKDRRGL